MKILEAKYGDLSTPLDYIGSTKASQWWKNVVNLSREGDVVHYLMIILCVFHDWTKEDC